MDEKISQQEANGHIIVGNYYNGLKKQTEYNIKQLTKERDELIKARDTALSKGYLEYESEEWINMSNQIDEVTKSIEEGTTAIQEYNKSIREADWSVFDLIQDRVSAITDEADFLIKLMEDANLYQDNGQLNERGMATMGLHAQSYNVDMEKASNYAKELKKLDEEIAKDSYNQYLIDRRSELLELQRESILAANEEKEAIKDLVSEGIEKELDALKELIEKYKDSLSSQKDLYSYQSKVQDQAEEIAKIQKQLSAYSGDQSEESKAKIQKLQVSLKDAQKDLKETEYDQYISDTEKMLDDLYDEYETILNTRLDNIDQLISDMIDSVNANASSIRDTLQSEAEAVGTTLSSELHSIWNGESASKIVSTYTDGISDSLTSIGVTVESINASVGDMVSNLTKTSKDDYSSSVFTYTTTTTKKVTTTKTTTKKSTTTKKTTATTKKSSNNYPYGKASETTGTLKVGSKGNAVKAVQYALNKLGYSTAVDGVFGNKTKSALIAFQKAMKITADGTVGNQTRAKFKAKGYASGSKRIGRDQLAWTQENGQEFIIRPSDGAILTPVAQDDKILNNLASNNIWDMANNPADFIRENLNISSGTQSTVGNLSNANTFNGNVSLEVVLPNVKNYEEFKRAMQHDKNFEKMVRAMTVDQMFGESSLKKYKY